MMRTDRNPFLIKVNKPLLNAIVLAAAFMIQLPSFAGNMMSDIDAAVANKHRPVKDITLDPMRKPAEVLNFFQIKKGMHVIDIFSGPGYYTELLSHVVGKDGRVAMHNHSLWEAYSKKASDARIAGNRLPNVYQDFQDLNNTHFKPESFDAATIILGMHDLYLTSEKSESGDKINPSAFLKALHKGLKKGAVVGVIEHEAMLGQAPEASAELHRLNSQHIIKTMKMAGFELEAVSYILHNDKDDHSKIAFDKSVRRQTDRAVLKFRKI